MRRNRFVLSSWLALAAWLVGGWSSTLTAGTHGAMGHTAAPTGHMGHAVLELPKDVPAPTVAIRVIEDAKAGWNVQVDTTNFRWAPEHASQAHVPGEGHAHLYVDGKKVARLYGPWFHLERLAPGTREVRVTLNANSHEELAVNGKILAATASVVVKKR
jgi:hypothetical protein